MNLENIFNKISSSDKKKFSRRDALKNGSMKGLAGIAASIPILGATGMKKVFANTSSDSIIDILNFALTLEYLESSFYQKGLTTNPNLIPAGDRNVFTQIANHEGAHVIVLRDTITALGGSPVVSPVFDFTASGTYADVFSNYQTFLTLSQSFEDTGVRAYKGQAAGLIANDAVLTAALQIHSVEARHASEVRRIRGQKGWISLTDSGGAPAAIYVREDNTIQGGIDVRTITTVSTIAITEAFDETLTKDEVLAIAGPFIVS